MEYIIIFFVNKGGISPPLVLSGGGPTLAETLFIFYPPVVIYLLGH